MSDDLDQFDYLADQVPNDEPPAEPAPEADDEPTQGEPQQQEPMDEPAEPQQASRSVPYARYQELVNELQRQEQRFDELMRTLLATGAPAPAQPPVEEDVDPEVESTVAPVLNKRLREYDDLLAAHRHSKQLDSLEEVSPGIRALWPQIREEWAKLPPHLQPEFDNMGGAIALRARVEAKAKPTSEAGKRRAHTEAGPTAGRAKTPTVSPVDVHKMTPSEFEAFTESLRGQRHGRAGEGYDSLIR